MKSRAMGHEAVSVLLIDHRGKGWREGELPGWLDIAKLPLSLEPSTARDSGGITQGTSCCFCPFTSFCAVSVFSQR